MEENFYVFFKNFHKDKNKEVPEKEKLNKKEEFFDSNYAKYNTDIANKKHLLEQIKSDTIQKM